MLRFGRMDAHERWNGCPVAVLEVALGLLLDALRASFDVTGQQVFVDPHKAVFGTHTDSCRLDVDRPGEGQLEGAVQWAAGGTEPLDGPHLRCLVTDQQGHPLAGLLIREERVVGLRDLSRALEASFDGGLPRDGRFAVVDSRRTPPAVVTRPTARDLAQPLAAFHCENPTCPARGQRVLVALLPTEVFDHKARRSYLAAFPCPSCPTEPWALSFVEVVESGWRSAKSAPFLRYPVRPLRRRVMPRPGPMSTVLGYEDRPQWGATWNADEVEPISPERLECLAHPRLSLWIKTASEGGWSGGLAGGLLSPTNLRALVDQCRLLPGEQKQAGLANALAFAYHPRRMAKFENADDLTQAALERYQYIAYAPGPFLERLRFFDLTEHTGRFLDVGSGIGEKPFLAYALGRFERCDGLELNARSLAVMEFLLSCIATDVPYPIAPILDDALTFDRYGEYDVVYMYRPFREPTRMGELFRHIAPQLRPGAACFDVFDRRHSLRREGDGFYVLDSEAEASARWLGPVCLETFLSGRF